MKKVLSIDIGCLHLGLCGMEFSSEKPRLVDLRVVFLGDKKAAPATTFVDRLITYFDEEYELLKTWSPDCVLIEQQVSAASLNLILAFSVYTLFRSRGMDCRLVRAAEKFQGWKRHSSLDEARQVIPDVLKTYYTRKKASVTQANELLRVMGCVDITSYPGCTKEKADDAADAFLQAFCA